MPTRARCSRGWLGRSRRRRGKSRRSSIRSPTRRPKAAHRKACRRSSASRCRSSSSTEATPSSSRWRSTTRAASSIWARRRAAEVPRTPLGYSVGEWEGSTLVVETTRLNEPYLNNVGAPMSPAAKLVERFAPTRGRQPAELHARHHRPGVADRADRRQALVGLAPRREGHAVQLHGEPTVSVIADLGPVGRFVSTPFGVLSSGARRRRSGVIEQLQENKTCDER